MRQPYKTNDGLHTCSTPVPVTVPCSLLSLHCAAPATASRTCWGWGLIWRDPHDWLRAEGTAQRERAPHCTDVTVLAVNSAQAGTETLLEDNSLYFYHMGTVNVINCHQKGHQLGSHTVIIWTQSWFSSTWYSHYCCHMSGHDCHFDETIIITH